MINDDIIRLRALEPEDLECLYQWENDMDLWEVSDTLTPFSLFTLKKYIETCHLDIYTTKQLRLMIERADKMSRTCFCCQVEPICNWKDEKKNLKLKY